MAVIIGASSGIGEASAERLAGLGATVALLARRADRLDNLVERITKSDGSAVAMAVDVADAGAVRAVADRVAAFIATLPPRVNLQQVTIMPTAQAG